MSFRLAITGIFSCLSDHSREAEVNRILRGTLRWRVPTKLRLIICDQVVSGVRVTKFVAR